jgi:ParB-like chromosome segregation protein Spo0J
MKRTLEFALLPLTKLRAHEEVVPAKVRSLAAELRRTGVFVDPIWVARDSEVILNGHHRTAALRRLGAERIPVWLLDYDSDVVRLERWTPGPPVSKAEVIRRAQEGELFSPQTTRHRLSVELPKRPTPLAELLPARPAPASGAQPRRPRSARAARARSSSAK